MVISTVKLSYFDDITFSLDDKRSALRLSSAIVGLGALSSEADKVDEDEEDDTVEDVEELQFLLGDLVSLISKEVILVYFLFESSLI